MLLDLSIASALLAGAASSVPGHATAGQDDAAPIQVPPAVVGADYAFDLAEVLPDGGGARFRLRRGPDGLRIDADGALSWPAGERPLGDHRVVIEEVADGDVARTASFFVTVTDPATVRSRVRVLDYPAATGGAERTYRVAILMINTLGDAIEDDERSRRLEFYAPETLGHLFFHHPLGAHSFLREASYGRVALSGSVVGWLNAPEEGLDAGDILAEKERYFALAAPHIDLEAYDVFVVHALVDGRGQQTGWLYPHQSFGTPSGRVSGIGLIWMINSAVFDEAPLERSYWSSGDAVLPSTSWAHEFLHTLGIRGHANSLDCSGATLALETPGNPIKGYGDVFSIMGEHAFGTHPGVLMKLRLGWLEPDRVPTVRESGAYDLRPLAEDGPGPKGLIVPLDPPLRLEATGVVFDALAVEFRRPIGFDRYLARLRGSPFLRAYKPEGEIDPEGLVVRLRYASEDTDGTVLLDMNPETSFARRGIKWPGNCGKFSDAILPVGRTFEVDGRVSLRPVRVTEGGALRVEIEFLP